MPPELSRANRETRTAREDLQRSERLASVGRLAAGVAHEVGNPVSALIVFDAFVRDYLVRLGGECGYDDAGGLAALGFRLAEARAAAASLMRRRTL